MEPCRRSRVNAHSLVRCIVQMLVLWMLASPACTTGNPGEATAGSAAEEEDDDDDRGSDEARDEESSPATTKDASTPEQPTLRPRDASAPKERDAATPAVPGPRDDAGAISAASGYCAVKPILDSYCVACHDGKGTGGSPMGLSSYEDLTAADPGTPSKKVYEVVLERLHDKQRPMPPKKVLEPAEMSTLEQWLERKAPRGEGPCASSEKPPTRPGEPIDGWDPSLCDAIYKITAHAPNDASSPLMVPAGQETHPQVSVDPPWGNEPVQAIAFRPITDNAKVLHHWILYAGTAFLTGWAPGDDERSPFPPDVGMDMPTGRGSLRLDMHYYNVGSTKAEGDRSGLEVCVVKKPNFRKYSAAVTMSLTSFGPVLAPANRSNYESTGTCRVTTTQPVHIMAAAPHAHKYARRMKFWVKKKDGSEVIMHDHEFVFGEQGSYPLDPEVIVETGDTIYTTCVYTNDTSKNITFGESTENEMCFNFAAYYPKGAFSCGGLGGGLFGN